MKQRGLTLIELLVAMTVSGLVIVLVSRIFLSGQSQSLLRSRESELLKERLALGWELERRVQGDSSISPAEIFRTHYPHLDSLTVERFKVDSSGALLPVNEGDSFVLAAWRAVFSWGSIRQVGMGSSIR